jgi:hypothetical protein
MRMLFRMKKRLLLVRVLVLGLVNHLGPVLGPCHVQARFAARR